MAGTVLARTNVGKVLVLALGEMGTCSAERVREQAGRQQLSEARRAN